MLGVSCVTNMACGVKGVSVSAEDVEKTADAAGGRMRCLLGTIIERI